MKTMIIDHTNTEWLRKQERFGNDKHNGAFYYSQEIVDNIIPNVKTDRNWVTVNVKGQGCDHAIIFVHSNLRPDRYEWLKKYKDLVLVCGVEETVDKVKHLGKTIYLPLSIDTEYVKQFKQPKNKRKGVAFAGRSSKKSYPGVALPYNVRCLSGMARDELLAELAQLEKVYAVGRTAIEARALGCEVLPYDSRYPDPDRWKVLDNREAAKMLQAELDKIEPRPMKEKENKKINNDNEWLEGFPEPNGIYKCLINGEEIKPLMHKKCSINGKHRWMSLDGYDALGNIKYKNKRLSIDEL